MTKTGPLATAHVVAKVPAQDLDRARRFYREKLGLEPVEERTGGLRYVSGSTEFHLFRSAGRASGESTQIGFEVDDLPAVVADLRSRGLEPETFDMPGFGSSDGLVRAPDNYPSRGTGELGVFFRDSEGNLLALGQPVR